MLKLRVAGNGTVQAEFPKFVNCPFGRAKTWVCKITVDIMENDCEDKSV
jgi:hypothetical protein